MKQIYFLDEVDVVDSKVFGGKGANLMMMSKMGLPVPQGFVITTNVCAEFLKKDKLSSEFFNELRSAIKTLEKKTGKKLGDAKNPLLLSVRSGAAVSMAGMMDSILNVGLNTKTMKGLAKKIESSEMVMKCYNAFCSQYMGAFQSMVPDDAKSQLLGAIWRVMRSWNNSRAIAYREKKGITKEMADGTAVVVMEMVFGNMNENSGTGIVFTRNPYDGSKKIHGEYLQGCQGTDLVSGLVTPRPIEEMKPEFISELAQISDKLEKKFKAPQEIEFTIEDDKLYLLQTRNCIQSKMAMVKSNVDLMKEGVISLGEVKSRVDVKSILAELPKMISPQAKKDSIVITSGIGASIGCVSGVVVFDIHGAIAFANAGRKVILVKQETSPEDIPAMFKSAGVLTTTGGKTSHAAVIAAGLGKPCVVGCANIMLHKSSFNCGNIWIDEGDTITIDGENGYVYAGEPDLVNYPISEEMLVLLKEIS